jgi:uncharacterized membrane protein
MEKNFTQNKIEQVVRDGYGLSLEGILSQSFEIYRRAILPGVIATFLYLIVMGFGGLSMFKTLYGMSLMEMIKTAQDNPVAVETIINSVETSSMLIYSAVMALIIALITPLLSGLYKVSYKNKYESESSVADLFSYYRQPYFLNIFIFSFLFGLISQLLSFFLGQAIPVFGSLIGFLIQVFLGVSLILTIPFIIFGNLSWIEAVRASFKVTLKNWFFLFFILLISTIIAFIGVILCGVGFLFSYPFLYTSTFILYDEIIGFPQQDEISEIGVK